MASVTISGSLMDHLRQLYRDGLSELARGNALVRGNLRNGYTELALPAYVVAVAAVEAFVNETFLGPISRMLLRESSLYQLGEGWLEKVELPEKMVITAALLLGARLRRDEQPFQDFTTLVKLRNEIVHYKIRDTSPRFVRHLNERSIGLDTKLPAGAEGELQQPWVWEVSSWEGIRWAHNTAAQTMEHMLSLVPASDEEYRERIPAGGVSFEHLDFLRRSALPAPRLLDDELRDRMWAGAGLPPPSNA